MEKKVVEFKKGDIIVSGGGNIGIFNGVVNGHTGERLTAYCSSDAPAGTDMRYARHATEEEKKIFFNALEKNGYTWNPDTFTIKSNEDCVLTTNFDAGRVDWKADGMHPFKVVGEKKRIRPTWTQVRELENIIDEQRELIDEQKNTVKGQQQDLKDQKKLIDEMKDMLERQTDALEKANELIASVRDDNLALRSENERLLSRSFLERLFNK